jgi:sec-independent protein translocase protein TatC
MVAIAALSEMSFLEHLEELRTRLLKSLAAVAIALLVSFTYAAELIRFLRMPAQRIPGIRLVAIDATEIFSLYFKASFLAAMCLATPIILWQVWQFIAPGLYRHERRYALPFLISTTLFFVAGAVFGYTVLVPMMLKLMVVMADPIHIEINMSTLSYLSFVSWMVLSMGFVFQIPPVVFLLSRIGLVNASLLARNFKYAILFSFVAGAVLTPSIDTSGMLLLALPMIALYAVGIVVALIFGRARKTEHEG